MGLKRHEDKPWEWTDDGCFSNEAKPECECDGVMELKDVNITGLHPSDLEKIWVCNRCGFVFVE